MTIVPKFLEHLPRHGEFPVPFVVMWINGKPDFRVIDTDKALACYTRRLCGICGRRLGEFSYFIGGDGCKRAHTFRDPGMHKPCAAFSAATCPFLAGKLEGYSERALPEATGLRLEVRPAWVPENRYIFKTRTSKTQVVPERGGCSFVFIAGPWQSVVQFSEGKS